MFSKTKYILLLLFILGLYLILNCTTKYIQRPPTFGSIIVQSTPDSANIFLDNDSTGKLTPDTLFDVPTGWHQISVSKEGYLPKDTLVKVHENEIDSISLLLAYRQIISVSKDGHSTNLPSKYVVDANYGFLYVSSIPENARIIIDNQFSGEYTPHLFANPVSFPSTDTVQLDFGLTPATTEGRDPGDLAWDFDLMDDFNNRIILSNYRGFIVIINLWSKDCPSCMKELDSLQAIYQDYQADSVKIFGINYGGKFGQEDLSTLIEVRELLNLTFTLLVGAGDDVVNDYKKDGTPQTILLYRNGMVYSRMTGFVEWYTPQLIRAKLDELLGK